MENQDLSDDDETIDPADFVATEQRQSMRQVMSNLDADPEKAARAQKLGEATGVPPALIHGDLENFEQQHKARLTAQLFDENRFLKDYVNSHPMAAAVSNDDYGQLDAVSDKVGKIGKQSVLSRAYADFNEGAGTQPFGDWFTKEVGPEYAASHPVTSTLYTLLGLPFELPARTISGALKATHGFLEQGYTQITGDEQGGKRFARDIVGMAEYKLLSPGHAPSILAANKELLTKAHEALQASEPYLKAGEEPPVGIHPEIDKLKIDQAKVDRDNLKEALTEAQGSATRERSPELFNNFIKQHTDAKISVPFDAVQRLYGDKLPHPEDGLLGWSPDIAEQYRQAAATGGDIEIPLSEWLAKVDPKVANELHDDMRMRPGGVTVNEGKDLVKNHAAIEKPIEPIEGAELEPKGDVAVKAVRNQASLHPFTDEQMGQLSKDPFHTPYIEGQQILSISGFDDKLHTIRSVGSSTLKTLMPKFDFSRSAGEIGEHIKTIADTILKAAGDTPVHILSDLEFDKLGEPDTAAFYDPKTHKIAIRNSSWQEDGPRILLHEAIHAATSRVLYANPDKLDRVSTLMLDIANKMPDLAEKYGYKDEHEFLAEAITDREFQARLADIDVSPDLAKAMGLDKPNATMWDAVIAYIRDLLGVPPGAVSALEAALRLTQETAETKLTAEDKAWLKSYKDAMPKAAKQGELDVTRQEDLAAFKANAIGMTVEQYKKYMGLIEKQKAEDAAYQLEQAKAEIAKRQTKEWKAAAASMRPDVKNDIATRPDIASANFFANGELYGEKVGKPKLRADLLSEEQKVGLPKEYLAKEGLNPDDVAGLFGYPSGSALIERLKQLEAARGDMPLKEFVEKQVDAEVSARMEKEHGNLDKNILDEAKDHVIGNTQMDLLHEETLALGMKAGSKMTFTKEDIKAWVKDQFGKTQVGSVSSDKFLSEAGKAGRAAELGLMEDNAAEAFRQKQRQYIAMRLADESRKFEKEKARFETTAKQFAKREVASVPQEYTNFIHDILLKVGQPVRRSIQDLQQSIDLSGFKDLESFVESKEADLREVPVAEFLYNDNFRKPIEQLTTEEFRAVHDSIKALIKNGRDERQVIKAGEAADLDIVRQQMIEELQTFKEKKYNASETMGDKIKHVARTYLVSHLQLESLFNRWDRGDPRGVFTQYVMRGLTSASNFEAALERKYSRLLGDIADKANLKELVDNNIFIDPLSRTKENPEGYPIERFNRKNLRAVLQNVGNKSNLDKLARGYKLKPEAIMDWLNQHATKEDWDWAQKQGEIFAEMKKESDVMYRNMTGIEPESIQIDPVQTVHGEYKGWYHPVVYHSIWEGQSKRLMGGDALEQNNYVRATTPRGYTKQRSGYAAPMSLDLDATPSRMKQMIHDIAFRPEVINASKIFYDKDIRAAITKHYGKEYRDLLVPYLRDVANSANFRSDAEAVGARTLEWFRQNIIASLIGFNPGTVMKHGPTAAINSLTEVGPINFAKAVKGLFSVNEATGDTNWSFAMNTSEELARRHRHYVETFTGAQEKVLQKPTFRDTMIKLGSYPVAMSDLLSAVPTWLAQYEKSMRDGVDHGEAMFMADRSVRRAHGSSVTTNRPAVMRGGPLAQWTTSLYGFFSHILNRQYELMWKASDTLGMAKEGNYADAAKEVPHLAWGLFSYVIFPALIEEMVTPISNDEHESWGKKSAKFLAKGLSSSWIGVRDVAQAILTSRDPASGLLGTTFKSVTDLTRDMSKTAPMSKQHAGSVIQHGVTAFGALTGLTNATEGRAAKFIYNYSTGQEKPKTMTHFWNGLRHGTMKERK